MKKIEFENEVVLKLFHLTNLNEKIRGRKLTDRESKYMYELEILKSEKRCDKSLKKLSRMKE